MLIASTIPRLLATTVLAYAAFAAQASELLTNGSFETGNYTGWTSVSQPGSSGALRVYSGNSSPVSLYPTVGASSGSYYSVTDQSGPGAYALLQSFVVPLGSNQVTLSFDMFVNDQSGSGPLDRGLDFTFSGNQHARVDLLSNSSTAFDTGAGVLHNFYLNRDAGPNPNPYTAYTFDISSYVTPGQTYQLRFAEVDNMGYFQQGVDNVSIQAISAVPEPESYAMMLAGLGALGFVVRRRRAG